MSCTTAREAALVAIAQARHTIDVCAGLRRYAVYVRVSTPSDGRGGVGATWTNVDTLLAEKPRVRSANMHDVVASGGRIGIADYILDRITPRNDADTVGTSVAFLSPKPDPAVPGQKVFFVLVGPDMLPYVASPPSGGSLFTQVMTDFAGSYEFSMVLTPVTGQR